MKLVNGINLKTATAAVSTYAGASGATITASFSNPWGLALDANDNLYVAENGGNKIQKINTSTGAVSTYASWESYQGVRGMAFDPSGNLYASCVSGIIYKITPSLTNSVFVGSTNGDVDGNGTSARLNAPAFMQFGSDGNLYVSDYGNAKIKKITLSGDVTTFTGGAILDGNGSSTSMTNPYGFVFDGAGNAFISYFVGNQIRKLSLTGYDISPALPSGLSFNSTNGTISGTPTTTTAAIRRLFDLP